jgi:hypothetical protein
VHSAGLSLQAAATTAPAALGSELSRTFGE